VGKGFGEQKAKTTTPKVKKNHPCPSFSFSSFHGVQVHQKAGEKKFKVVVSVPPKLLHGHHHQRSVPIETTEQQVDLCNI
jgi:hypothetical protein